MTCPICDRRGGPLVEYHGISMHDACAPPHWRKDHEDLTAFMDRFYVWWKTPAADKWKRRS